MKQFIAIGLAVALVVELGLFFGLGVGLGALSTTGAGGSCNAADQYCYTQNNFWASGQSNGGIEIQVTSDVQTGAAPVTAMLSGGTSTPITFEVTASDNGCPRAGAWQGGYEAYWTITWPQSVTGTIDGTQYSGSIWTGDVLAQNNSIAADRGDVVGCVISIGSGSQTIPGPDIVYQHVIKLSGLYPVMSMTMNFHSFGSWCDGSWLSPTTDRCYAIMQATGNGGGGYSFGANNGGFDVVASASFTWQSAQASFQFIDQNLNYNGGTLTVVFYTAYDGPNGYNFTIELPTERNGGGAADPDFSSNPMVIPNFCTTGCQYKWSISKDLPTNLSGHDLAWDFWLGVLNAGLVNEQTTKFTVINPLYAPTTPVITYTTSGTGLYPATGDSVTLTIYSNASQESGMVNNISVSVYYLGPGQTAQQGYACGPGWVTSCPNGQQMTVVHNGNNAVGTFTFTVSPPVGDTAIGVAAASGSTNSPSLFGYLEINIKASDCSTGQSCNPITTNTGLWQLIGPILLALIILTATVLGVLWVPAGQIYIRYGIPVVVGVLIVILWVVGDWTSLFATGGALNARG